MRILVTGGTGFLGSRLCRELADRDHEVIALARSPGDGSLPEAVIRRAADVTDYEDLVDHFEDVDVVINLVSLSPLFKPPRGTSHESVHLRGTENCVRAAETHGVRKLVQLSALGADPTGPTAYIRAKGRADRIVADADLAHTIVRPSVIFGDGGEFVPFVRRLTTPYVTGLPGGGRTRFQPIWVEDIAPIIADCIEGDHDGETYELGGPEVLSLADVTRLVWRSRGKSVTVVPVPMPVAKLGLVLAEPLPFVPFGADQGRALEMDNVTEHNEVTAFDVDPDDLRTLADYLEVA